MCGIAGIHIKNSYVGSGEVPLDNLVNGLLVGIEPRGRDATGLVAVTKDKAVTLEKNNVPASTFIQRRGRLPEDTKTVLLHTRFATQGKAEFMENNHPVVFRTCFAVHNGHINNDAYLVNRAMDEQDVKHRPAEVDSIAIPMVLAQYGWDNAEEALKELNGACATAIIDPLNQPGELILARVDSSPLFVLNHKKMILWASSESAIANAWAWFIGTPPDKKKIRWIPEGYIIRVNADDEYDEKRFKEIQSYGYGWNRNQQKWWDDEDDDRSVTKYTSKDDEIRCFECGLTEASLTIEDGAGGVSWDVPVCTWCYNKLNGKADKLEYRHCRSDIVRLRFEKDKNNPAITREAGRTVESRCEDCEYFYVSQMTPDGKFLCDACATRNESEKPDPLILTYGDQLPDDMAGSVGPCEDCLEHPATMVGGEGSTFVCHKCFLANDDTLVDCDGCGSEISALSATGLDGSLICDVCESSLFDADDRRDNPVYKYIEEADNVIKEVDAISLDIGARMDTSPVFVQWLLHYCSVDRLEDPALYEVWERAQELFAEVMKELNATTQAEEA